MALLTPSGSEKPTRLVSVPFTLPGELVKIHVHRHEPEYYMSHGDLLEIIKRSEKRDEPTPPEELPSHAAMSEEAKEELRKVREKFGNRVQCRYFGTCSGCQVSRSFHFDQLSATCADQRDLYGLSISPSLTKNNLNSSEMSFEELSQTSRNLIPPSFQKSDQHSHRPSNTATERNSHPTSKFHLPRTISRTRRIEERRRQRRARTE